MLSPLDAYSLDAYSLDAYPLDAYSLDAYPLDAYPLDSYPLDSFSTQVARNPTHAPNSLALVHLSQAEEGRDREQDHCLVAEREPEPAAAVLGGAQGRASGGGGHRIQEPNVSVVLDGRVGWVQAKQLWTVLESRYARVTRLIYARRGCDQRDLILLVCLFVSWLSWDVFACVGLNVSAFDTIPKLFCSRCG
jgi:hypothetical protein